MPDHSFQPVTREQHGARRWVRYTNYGFAAGDALLPVYGPELARMAMELPLAFVRVNGQIVPVAVMGVEPGRNLYVDSGGQWLGQYVPAIVRSHPFALLRADALF